MNTKLLIGAVISAVTLFSGRATFAQAPATELKRVEESDFGKLSDGTAIKAFTLTNAKGAKARVITYGAIIAGIQVPDKDGKMLNVVATADDAASMQRYMMKAYTVGRFANRIAGGKFPLEGAEITLPAGRGGAVLHSGAANFGEKAWEGKALPPTATEGAAQMTYVSKDGDGGFPGTLTLKLTFSLNDDNEFKLAYEATTDKTTVINVTNHAYFNLAGAQGFGNTAAMTPAADHELWVDADKYLEMNRQIPTGKLLDVKDTAFDFTKPVAIGSRSAQVQSYDHAFELNNKGKMALVARLRDPKTGREMVVKTDQPGLQVYSGQRAAVALETQHHPDSPNHPEFPTTVLKAGETFKTVTIYGFSAK